MVPLQQDLQREQKRLRLPPERRKGAGPGFASENDLARSRLLHRLNVLNIPWEPVKGRGQKGTFHEVWRVQWKPESRWDHRSRSLGQHRADSSGKFWRGTRPRRRPISRR